MANFVQIANLAGTLTGTQAGITDPDDNRLLARTVRHVWDLQRRATIRDGEWNFAAKRAALPALAGAAPYPWANAFQMPPDAVRLLELIDDPTADYTLEGKQILCNAGAPLNIRYAGDVEEPALWDDSFADAFAKRIAWQIGKKIAGSAYDATSGERIYQEAVSTAKSVDARENPPIEQEEDDWILARHIGGWG